MGITRRAALLGIIAVVGSAALLAVPPVRRLFHPVIVRIRGRATVDERVAQLGEAARSRIRPSIVAAGIAYPPGRVTLVVFKNERRLEVYAGPTAQDQRHITSYVIRGASGDLGPKLREGDRQVPEGLYRIESLNPNSRFHLSMRIDYPNAFDRRVAEIDGRANLGGDIFVHGGSASIGCVAIGDDAVEELFVMVADCGIESTEVIISPVDLRVEQLPTELDDGWRCDLYDSIRDRLGRLSRRSESGV